MQFAFANNTIRELYVTSWSITEASFRKVTVIEWIYAETQMPPHEGYFGRGDKMLPLPFMLLLLLLYCQKNQAVTWFFGERILRTPIRCWVRGIR